MKNTDTNTDCISPAAVCVKIYTVDALWQQAWAKAGKSLFYMQFIHPDVDWGGQKERIERMCYHLAAESKQRFEDTSENRKWFQEWIERFDDEVENQC